MNDPTVLLPQGMRLRTRELTTVYVNKSKSTDLWICRINVENPKNKDKQSVKAFSFPSETEARETAYVNAPPKMIKGFQEMTNCFCCEAGFSKLYRRPVNCRNCGVCVCKSCSVSWDKSMLPDTYNTKNCRTVKICMTCDFLNTTFRHALLGGDLMAAKNIYMTGNINLRCAFANVKRGNEVMLPIHCAVAGGNLDAVRWLVDLHHCPIKMINVGNNKRFRTILIQTSKGRNVIDLAIDGRRTDVLKYLISEKNLSVRQGAKYDANPSYDTLELLLQQRVDDVAPQPILVTPKSTIMAMSPRTEEFKRKIVQVKTVNTPQRTRKGNNFEFGTPSPAKSERQAPSLPMHPRNLRRIQHLSGSVTQSESSSDDENARRRKKNRMKHNCPPLNVRPHLKVEIPSYDISMNSDDDISYSANLDNSDFDDEESVVTTMENQCILCCEAQIDCVFRNCGHQISCLGCANKVTQCPICNTPGGTLKIFKP